MACGWCHYRVWRQGCAASGPRAKSEIHLVSLARLTLFSFFTQICTLGKRERVWYTPVEQSVLASTAFPWVLIAMNRQCGCTMRIETTAHLCLSIDQFTLHNHTAYSSQLTPKGKLWKPERIALRECTRLSLFSPECRFE